MIRIPEQGDFVCVLADLHKSHYTGVVISRSKKLPLYRNDEVTIKYPKGGFRTLLTAEVALFDNSKEMPPMVYNLPQKMQVMLYVASEIGLKWIPPIERNAAVPTPLLDSKTYAIPCIRLPSVVNVFGKHMDSEQLHLKALAHELGHCWHIQAQKMYPDISKSEEEYMANIYAGRLILACRSDGLF